MLGARVVTAALGILIFLVALFTHPLVFALLVSMIAFLAMRELLLIIHLKQFHRNSVICLFSASSTPLLTYLYGAGGLLFGISFFVLLIFLKNLSGRSSFENSAASVMAIVYVAGGLSFLVMIRMLSPRLMLLLAIIVWLVDSYQYFAGRKYGRRQLAPLISPKKTVEGAKYGILLAAISTGLLFNIGWFFDGSLLFGINAHGAVSLFVVGTISALVLGAVALAGDLFESSLKREVGIKDSGTIMPGHGGVLDRFDSMLFVSVLGYFWIIMLSDVIR